MVLVLWVAILLFALVCSYLYLKRTYSVFSKYGVKTLTCVPFLGTMTPVILKRMHLADHWDQEYRDFEGERFYGKYELVLPVVAIRDRELIKRITIKDFDHFTDHKNMYEKDLDPLYGKPLTALKGQEWKDMRSTLSPVFTSGKLKLMLPLMEQVGLQMTQALKQKIQYSGTGYIDVNVKDVTTRFASDVIASCVYGMKVDSHAEPENHFYRKGKEISTISYIQFIKLMLISSVPRLAKILGIKMFSKSSAIFINQLIKKAMEEQVPRPDLMQRFVEAKREYTHDDVLANAHFFFAASFDTMSNVMSFVTHELALHPEVQNKLYQEITETEALTGGKLDYNTLQSMKYLNMVISEVLRLWPPAVGLHRVCLKHYNIGKPNDKATQDFIISRGMGIRVSIWSIHRDAAYFPDPLRFDPERFSDENKHNIQPFTYMPFGLGPRSCIASKFALFELKVMVYHLVRSMELSPNERTCISWELEPNNFILDLRGGHWLRMKSRQRT